MCVKEKTLHVMEEGVGCLSDTEILLYRYMPYMNTKESSCVLSAVSHSLVHCLI